MALDLTALSADELLTAYHAELLRSPRDHPTAVRILALRAELLRRLRLAEDLVQALGKVQTRDHD